MHGKGNPKSRRSSAHRRNDTPTTSTTSTLQKKPTMKPNTSSSLPTHTRVRQAHTTTTIQQHTHQKTHHGLSQLHPLQQKQQKQQQQLQQIKMKKGRKFSTIQPQPPGPPGGQDVEEISYLERRKRAFMPTEAPHGYTESLEMGPEYLEEPDEEKDPELHKNLNTLLNSKYNFGFKSYSEVIHDKSDSKIHIPTSGPNMISTVDLEKKLQREQSMEEAMARAQITRMQLETDKEFLDRDQQDKIEAQRRYDEEKELEEYANRRTALKPIRSTIPPEVQKLSKTLVLEARYRQLDEHGERPEVAQYQSEPVVNEEGVVHDSKQTVLIDGQEFVLAEMQDKQIISEIIRISMDWNRSGVRNKPLQTTDLRYNNKAKLEEGVSPYFSANRDTTGREFTYHKFISDVEKAAVNAGQTPSKRHTSKKSLDEYIDTPKNNHDQTTTTAPKQLSYAEQFPNKAEFAPLMSLDFSKEDNEEVRDDNLIGSTISLTDANKLPPLPSLPHNIAMPTSLGLMKQDSPYKELHPEKPQVSLNDKIASNSQELANQLIHRDFLHNSIIRRKPRGKLTELELRDALVDSERAHNVETIFNHYEISMLSLFEEANNSQSISKASDVIGGFTPVYLRVKTDFDPTFIKMIQLLHEQQKLSDEAQELEETKTTFFGISNELEELEKLEKKKKRDEKQKASNEAERKHLEFLSRLMKADKDGYSTLHKDDVLIPDFPDSVIEIILSETLDKQIKANKTVDSNDAHHTPNKNKVKSNLRIDDSDDEEQGSTTAQRVDSTMRDSMMNEILLFKGRTIGELHQMGCFNRNPYDDVNQEEYTPGAARNDFEEGGQRNRYAFTDDMKHMHRFTQESEAQMHKNALYGGKTGKTAQEQYMSRMEQRNERFRAAAKRKKIPLMSETGGFIEPILSEDKKEFSPFYEVKENMNSHGQTTQEILSLSKISRFAQLAMASTVISKYGGLDSAYRQATGITMQKIDDLIIDALDQGDVPIKQMSEIQRKDYLTKLKHDALEFPKMAFQATSEQIHVPHMTSGVFEKIPSRYFGAWDYETALNGAHLQQMGILNHSLHRLGPYHPMFLVAVGGRGFTQENTFEIDELRHMLRGDIDERPDVKARRTARWRKEHPTLDPDIVKPFIERESFTPPTADQLSKRYDPLEHISLDQHGDDDFESKFYEENEAVSEIKTKPYRHYTLDEEQQDAAPTHDDDHDIHSSSHQHQYQQMMKGGKVIHAAEGGEQYKSLSFAEEAAAKALAAHKRSVSLDNIAEIVDDDDEAELDHKYQKEQQQAPEEPILPADKPGQSRPQLPRQYPQLHNIVESFDPNEITFNTGSMTEFHKTHEVNEYDLKETSEKLLAEAELTYKEAKKREYEAIHDVDNEDVSHKMKLRYFVDTDYQREKSEKIQREIDGNYTGVVTTDFKDADIVTLNNGDSRTKPNPFAENAPSQLKIDTKNPQHELYGGPITVQHFLSSMINTEEGREIAHGIEMEHRDFLGDKVYEQALKDTPVGKPVVLKKPPTPKPDNNVFKM